MYRNILVPIALDHNPETGHALEVARLLAAEGATITALTVIEAVPAYIEQQLPQGQIERNMEEAEAELKAKVAPLKGIRTVVLHGNPRATILDHAAANDIDLIVIASHRPGLSDYFLGSTAARIVRHAQCSVHVLR